MTVLTAAYGSWQSPITASLAAGETIRLSEVRMDGPYIYWVEGRPKEDGRVVVVRALPDGSARVDVTPPYIRTQLNFNVRTRAHSYGGGAWTVHNGILYFSNFRDGRLYRQSGPGAAPEPLTPKPANTNLQWSYADGVIDAARNRWIGVLEDNTEPEASPSNRLVVVDLANAGAQPGTMLIAGRDFFSSPRLSPDGSKLAWLAWDHPNMPWQGTTLHVVELDTGGMAIGAPQQVAGGANVSVFQPEWSPDGSALLFASDQSGWWNLYRHTFDGKPPQALAPRSAEFGAAQWNFGMSAFAFVSSNCLVCAYVTNGVGKLALLDLAPGPRPLADLALPFDLYGSVRSTGNGCIAFTAGAPDKVVSVVSMNPRSNKYVVLQKASDAADNPAIARYFTTAKRIEFPTEGNQTAYGLFYPPANPDYAPVKGEEPPLIVKCHGGPTAAAGNTLDLGIQFWTSRGIAVLDVNYGGSTGYGREYRNRLYLNWGIVDVDDCVNGAKYVVEQGWADGKRTVISGGSAGGYTTLATLAFRTYFEGGASYYGISDLERLTKDTHKFESHYLDWLIGPYPQEKERYRQRSPLHFARSIARPVIFFQGADDPVVPPNQTDLMVEALRSSGSTVGYILFSKESHGFRVAENIRTALDAELQFFSFQIFGTRLATGAMDLPAPTEQPMPQAPVKP